MCPNYHFFETHLEFETYSDLEPVLTTEVIDDNTFDHAITTAKQQIKSVGYGIYNLNLTKSELDILDSFPLKLSHDFSFTFIDVDLNQIITSNLTKVCDHCDIEIVKKTSSIITDIIRKTVEPTQS
ncbi:MAG: hypothetical protein AAF153_02235, partial [Pseudomonadota bacterium]